MDGWADDGSDGCGHDSRVGKGMGIAVVSLCRQKKMKLKKKHYPNKKSCLALFCVVSRLPDVFKKRALLLLEMLEGELEGELERHDLWGRRRWE